MNLLIVKRMTLKWLLDTPPQVRKLYSDIHNTTPLYTCICVDDSRRSSIEELLKTLPRNMVFSSQQIRLSNTVGQGMDLECQDPIIILHTSIILCRKNLGLHV